MDIQVKYLERKIKSLERKLSRLKDWITIQIKDVEIPDEVLESEAESDWEDEIGDDGNGEDKIISCQFGGEFIRKKAKRIQDKLSTTSQPQRTSTRLKNSKLSVKTLVTSTIERVEEIDEEDPLKIEDEEVEKDSSNLWVHSLPPITNWSICKADSASDFYENVEKNVDSPSASISMKPKILCSSCNEEFSSTIELKKHKDLQHPFPPSVCEKCGSMFAKQKLLNDHITRMHKNGPKKCPICSQMLAFSSFKKHLRLHTKIELKLCQICGKGFRQMSNLRAHEKEKHEKTLLPKFNCTHENCSKSFVRKRELERHLETHLPTEERSGKFDKKYIKECPYCSKSMNGKSLKKHIVQTHLQIRPYTCPVENCGKSFYTKKDMDVHCNVHLNPQRPEFSLEFSQNCPESLTRFLSKHKKYKRKAYENSRVKKEQDVFD